MKKLPILISIPHGGYKIPDEINNRISIKESDLFDDSDPYTIEIYNLGDKVSEVITTDIARAFVDLNRSPDDRPPKNTDGIVKSVTCYAIPIYITGMEPDNEIVENLIKSYYEPYHNKIKKALSQIDVELALDCHSMADIAPPISPDIGKKRPMICLGNVYGETCSMEITKKLADCFQYAFSLEESEVAINKPFSGGYIIRTYGEKPIPWIQVEMNRALYLRSTWFKRNGLKIDRSRLNDLNKMFETTLHRFFF